VRQKTPSGNSAKSATIATADTAVKDAKFKTYLRYSDANIRIDKIESVAHVDGNALAVDMDPSTGNGYLIVSVSLGLMVLPRLPGIGARTAQRLAFHILRADAEDATERVDLLVRENVQVASFALAPNERQIKTWKDAGVRVVTSIGARRPAETVAAWGVDAVVVQGGEGGGHTGSVATTLLLPQVADAVDIPVIAAGGFFDGRGLVAALAYGAAGIAMGTRFLLSRESTVPESVKQYYLARTVADTVVTARIDGVERQHDPPRHEREPEGVLPKVQGVDRDRRRQPDEPEREVAPPAEPVWLEADPVRLVQIVVNLLNNAAKYTEPGGRVWLSAGREGQEAVLRVRDTGMGIPPEMLPHVFELFTQGEWSAGHAQGGMGIGLALVRRLVELHGGTITASSAGLGQGSEFVVRLPASPVQSVRRDGPARHADEQPVSPGPRPSRRRILVVDDNVDAANTLSMLLELEGHEIRVAYDGPAALKAAEDFLPEVVLLDIGLPRMDGYEVGRRLRERPATEKVLLVALTGYGKDEDRQRSHEAGFNAHLVKPVDLDGLRAVLTRPALLGQGRRT